MSSQPVEFSLESVRQLMLANGGRITNHDLVKSFKRWLTDPQEKENARAQFKDYVNTLATIKQENGEKYLILKKKFYPEYYSSCGYSPAAQYESFPSDTGRTGVSPGYRHTPYDPPQQSSNNFSRQNSYTAGPLSSYPGAGAGLVNGNNSPSLLDEVMAGWAPPSRSMATPGGRQLPAVPQQSINSLGLPSVAHNSVGLPTSSHHRPDSHLSHINSQSSLGSGHSYSHLPDQRNSLASLSSGQSYSQLSEQRSSLASLSSGQGYPQLPEQRNSVSSGQSYSQLSEQRNSVSSGPSYSQLPEQRNSVSSLASSSGTSYLGGSPRQSYAGYGQPRTSFTQLHLAQPPPPSRPPPPYRPPPSDPVLPPSSSSSPPPPPRRGLPADSPSQPPPPPLPRRQLPSTAQLQHLEVGLPVSQGRGVPAKQHSLIESQQPSPTDSGFTEDPSKFSDYPLPRNCSLSKSIGNLSLENSEKTIKMEGSVSLDNLDTVPSKEDEKVVSVRERTKTFNRMASETELPSAPAPAAGGLTKLPPAVKRRNSRAVEMMGGRRISNKSDHDDTTDSSSITTIDPTIKQWMVHTSKGDYQAVAKMLMENPKLSRHRDFTSGYTGLHWACKHGNLDMVKLLAGTYQASVNVKSHGGYTPLHIAAQHNHQEVFDLLVQAYRADANIRDYAGKKPRQYMIIGDTAGLGLSISNDTFRQLKDGRKNRASRNEKNPGILRFGSLSVKVKKTTEAFNNYFNKDGSNDFKPKWESDVSKMPPPKFAPIKKRKSKRTVDFGRTKSAPVTPERSPVKEVIPEAAEENISDSDSEYGFGDKWGPGERRVSHA